MKKAEKKTETPGIAEAAEMVRTAHIVFPDEQAVVKVLEILLPFQKPQRDLILQSVAASLDAGYPRTRLRCAGEAAWNRNIRKVICDEPIPSAVSMLSKRRSD